MKRILFILVAFSILNQSIDFDFIVQPGLYSNAVSIGYDDVDSITEYLVETIMDDDHYMDETGNDGNGMPQNKSVYKLSYSTLHYSDRSVLLNPNPGRNARIKRPQSLDFSKICNGYTNVPYSPPDAIAS